MRDVKYNFNPKLIFVNLETVKYQGGIIVNVTLNTIVDLKTLIVILSCNNQID